MLRHLVVASAVAIQVCAGSAARSDNPPLLDGDLQLAVCGERSFLWMDLYAVALYLPRAARSRDALRRIDVAKAVRIDPTYRGKLPSKLPHDWRRRIEGSLPPDQMALLDRVFARMTPDAVATIVFRPESGTVLAIGDEVVGQTGDSRLIHAVIGIWLDPDYPLELRADRC